MWCHGFRLSFVRYSDVERMLERDVRRKKGMACPDIDRIVAYGLGECDVPDLEAHAETCRECLADLCTINALIGGPEEDVSEEFVSRIVPSLPDPESNPPGRAGP